MLAFLVCFLLASVPLSGAVFSSNALMQPLEEISSIPSEGYALVRDGSSDYLYLDGAVVKTVTREGGQEVTREGGSESIRTFSDGRLVSEQRPDGTVLQYDYSENGTLRRIEYIADGETVSDETLRAKGLLKGHATEAKILSDGEITKKLVIDGVKISGSASEKIKAAGGEVK